MKKSSINRLIVLLHAMNYFVSLGIFMQLGMLYAEVIISLFDPKLLSLYFYHHHMTEEQSNTQFLFLGWQCVGGCGRHRGMR